LSKMFDIGRTSASVEMVFLNRLKLMSTCNNGGWGKNCGAESSNFDARLVKPPILGDSISSLTVMECGK
jgi:hypothetical protein